MFTVLDIKKNRFTYYENEQLFTGVCDKIYKKAPKTNYANWIKEIRRNAIEHSLDFIGFTHDTFIQNNSMGFAFHRKQPTVMACKTVLKTLNLTKDLNYLVVNAGGNRLFTMPFFRALQNLNKLTYTKDILLNTKLTKNIITLDCSPISRAKYKFNYLDYINNGYSVILGACEKLEYPYFLRKALKEAKNYVILYSDVKDNTSNFIFQGNNRYKFYVYDVQNLTKPMQYSKIKKDEMTDQDNYKILFTEQDKKMKLFS